MCKDSLHRECQKNSWMWSKKRGEKRAGNGSDASREELDGGSEEHRHKFVVVVASIEPWQTINRLSSSPHYQQTDYFGWIDDPVAQTWMRVMSKKVAKVAKVMPVLLLT